MTDGHPKMKLVDGVAGGGSTASSGYPILFEKQFFATKGWVNSFSGAAVDLHALGTVCRTHNVLFVVNGSQALGARPLDISQTPLDAFTSCGFKWLCGPYATGFCWIRPEVAMLRLSVPMKITVVST